MLYSYIYHYSQKSYFHHVLQYSETMNYLNTSNSETSQSAAVFIKNQNAASILSSAGRIRDRFKNMYHDYSWTNDYRERSARKINSIHAVRMWEEVFYCIMVRITHPVDSSLTTGLGWTSRPNNSTLIISSVYVPATSRRKRKDFVRRRWSSIYRRCRSLASVDIVIRYRVVRLHGSKFIHDEEHRRRDSGRPNIVGMQYIPSAVGWMESLMNSLIASREVV